MKVHLMYADSDFDPDAALPLNEPDLAADLELPTLLAAMGNGDKFLYEIARHGLHASLASPAEIVYRQHVLADCAANPGVVRDLYDLAAEAIGAERQVFGFIFRGAAPDTVLDRSRQVMELYGASLRRLAELGPGTRAASAPRGSAGSSPCSPASSPTTTSPKRTSGWPSSRSGAAR